MVNLGQTWSILAKHGQVGRKLSMFNGWGDEEILVDCLRDSIAEEPELLRSASRRETWMNF